MRALQLTPTSNTVGVPLPRDVPARPKVATGEVRHLAGAAHGVTLTPHEPGLDAQTEAGREPRHAFQGTFHQLAR